MKLFVSGCFSLSIRLLVFQPSQEGSLLTPERERDRDREEEKEEHRCEREAGIGCPDQGSNPPPRVWCVAAATWSGLTSRDVLRVFSAVGCVVAFFLSWPTDTPSCDSPPTGGGILGLFPLAGDCD